MRYLLRNSAFVVVHDPLSPPRQLARVVPWIPSPSSFHLTIDDPSNGWPPAHRGKRKHFDFVKAAPAERRYQLGEIIMKRIIWVLCNHRLLARPPCHA